MDRQRPIPENPPQSYAGSSSAQSLDHSLVLAVINDLVRMRQNLDNMDDAVKGVSQLRNRIRAIFTTLQSRQYEIPDLLGQSYHDGDNIIVSSAELNEVLPKGTNRIKRVIKPQVSFQGKMIQVANVVIESNE